MAGMETPGDPVSRLVAAMKKLPGVSEKGAIRIAHHLMKKPSPLGREISEAVLDLCERSRPCRKCFSPSLSDECRICSNPRRDHTTLCVVENIPDLLAVEKSGAYSGLFLVLGGALSPLDGVGPQDLNLGGLKNRVLTDLISEVIVATNMSTEGEATANYIIDLLSETGVNVTRIASGLPAGAELEFADKVTVARALTGRRGPK